MAQVHIRSLTQTVTCLLQNRDIDAGYALLTAVQYLVQSSDTVEVVALQSEHRDGTDVTGYESCHMITDRDMDEHQKVTPNQCAFL